MVQLISTSPSEYRRSSVASPDRQDGSLSISGLTPGSYRVVAHPWGPNCVASVTSGSTDLMRNNFVVTPGTTPEPIDVALNNDCSSLEISTNQQGGQPASAQFLIVPAGQAAEPQVLFAGSGKAKVGNLAPGDYQIYAFADLNGIEYANPDVLRKYSGQHVSLSPNDKAIITVDVNSP